MRKKYLNLAIILTFMLSLSACKTNNVDNNASDSSSSQEGEPGEQGDSGDQSGSDTGGDTVTTKYIVAFNSNGGTSISNVEVVAGNKLTKPTDPTRASDALKTYTFAGWYKDEGLSVAFNFDTDVITANTTLYAKWNETVIQYTVTYFNGDARLGSDTVNAGSTITYGAPEVTGYTFAGWYTDKGFTTRFDTSTPITKDLILYAKYVDNSAVDSTLVVDSYKGYNEGIFVNLNVITGLESTDYKISYKSDDATEYTQIDSELVRIGEKVRADIVGLKAGTYSLKIEANAQLKEITNITVTADDRSGYAHFGTTTGVGAYNNDGTLKSNAVVVYVTDATKNTVQATIGSQTYTGLTNIIQNANSNYPLDIRILDEIKTTQWNYIDTASVYGAGNSSTRLNTMNTLLKSDASSSYWDSSKSSNYDRLYEEYIKVLGFNSMSDDEAEGITQLSGLTNYISWDKKDSSKHYTEFDSFFNELDVNDKSNITIEGIGSSAKIFQWGFAFNRCNSIEVKNIEFSDYTEDAIGFQGRSNTDMNYGNYWIHNCTFNLGVNNWDLTYENDKKDGDGSTDFKCCHNMTISYCRYNNTHKTNLVGSSDSSLQYNMTIHHNFYNNCSSRLPLLRQTNAHIYNNYYLNCSTTQDIRANAFVYSEFNYFGGTSNSSKVTVTSTYPNTVIKSFGDYFVKGATSATVVDYRNQQLSGSCFPNGMSTTTDYTNFDTNASLFYYDTTEKCSDVKYLNTTEILPTLIPTVAGSGLFGEFDGTNIVDTSGYKDENIEELISNATYTTEIPTTAGWFGKVISKDSSNVEYALDDYSSTSYVSINNETGAVSINDTSETETTYAYYMFENTYTSGTHTYTIDLTLTGLGSKWSIVQFLDGDKNISIRSAGLASTDNKKYAYSVDGNATETVISDSTWAAGNYTIVLTVNYDTSTTTISINGTSQTISGWTPKEITGVQFMTAYKAADRSLTVTKIEAN